MRKVFELDENINFAGRLTTIRKEISKRPREDFTLKHKKAAAGKPDEYEVEIADGKASGMIPISKADFERLKAEGI